MAFPIDHLFTVTTDREAARAALAGMGFKLTERGEHPGRGTSNHLMFFGRCYWELLAIEQPPAAAPGERRVGRRPTPRARPARRAPGCAERQGAHEWPGRQQSLDRRCVSSAP